MALVYGGEGDVGVVYTGDDLGSYDGGDDASSDGGVSMVIMMSVLMGEKGAIGWDESRYLGKGLGKRWETEGRTEGVKKRTNGER